MKALGIILILFLVILVGCKEDYPEYAILKVMESTSERDTEKAKKFMTEDAFKRAEKSITKGDFYAMIQNLTLYDSGRRNITPDTTVVTFQLSFCTTRDGKGWKVCKWGK